MKHGIRWWLIGILLTSTLLTGCEALGRGVENLRVGEWVEDALGRIAADDDGPLTASGTIQAQEIRVASELGGQIVEVKVRRGDQVRAGDELVVLDGTQVRAKLDEARAAVASARAELAVVERGPRVEAIAASEAELALARAQRDGALAAWQNAQEAIRMPRELDARIIEAQTQIDLAEQGAILAQAQLERERLVRGQKRKGSTEREVADLQVQAAEKALAIAQAEQETAQTLLSWLQLIRGRPIGLIAQAHAAEGAYRIAEEGIAIAEAKLSDLRAGATPEEVAVAEQAVRLAEAQAGVLEATLDKLTLTSPVDGVVLDQTLRAGELAAPATAILTLSDLSQVVLVVYVPENRVGQVQLGHEVRVGAASLPDHVSVGTVSHISDQPEFTPRNVATKEERLNTFYAVEIQLDNREGTFKPGMPADATF